MMIMIIRVIFGVLPFCCDCIEIRGDMLGFNVVMVEFTLGDNVGIDEGLMVGKFEGNIVRFIVGVNVAIYDPVSTTKKRQFSEYYSNYHYHHWFSHLHCIIGILIPHI